MKFRKPRRSALKQGTILPPRDGHQGRILCQDCGGIPYALSLPLMNSAMAKKSEMVFFPGPVGELEGIFSYVSRKVTHLAVLCHPHPLYGGTMHNKVIYSMATALNQIGYATVRFNFREWAGPPLIQPRDRRTTRRRCGQRSSGSAVPRRSKSRRRILLWRPRGLAFRFPR